MFEKFFQKSKEKPEYFVALELESEKIGAAVFTIADGKAKVKGLSIEQYVGDWQRLIEATDVAVSKAAGEIALTEIKKAVFGLPPNFLEGDKLSKDKLPHLKKLTSELELIPCGFVIVPEAINFYLEEKEGGLQTNILIGVTKKEFTVSLFRVGKLTEQIKVERSEYVTSDLEKALEKFKGVDIFPSKILLYDGEDLESVKEELLKYPWAANNKFLHFPKIEILPINLTLLAVVSAAASELTKKISEQDQEEVTKERIQQEKQEVLQITAKRVDPRSLGFIKEDTKAAQVKDLEPPLVKDRFKISLPKIPLKFPKILPQGKKITLFIIVFIMIVFLAVSGYVFASYQFPKATLTLIVDPKVFETVQEISVNTELLTPSGQTNEIPGKLLTLEVSGTKNAPTTGKKIIGDPAKGMVTLYNKTTTTRTFDKGTKISAKNLVFTLDDASTVPAATESVDGLKYGKSTGQVTTVKIGPEGNLPSQTEFIIVDFSTSSYSGRNEQAFSGGTSREVSSVSSFDQESVVTTLSEELKEQAKKELASKLATGEKLLDTSLSAEVVSRKFSHEVGAQAAELTLNLVMKYQGVSYQEKDLLIPMEKIVAANILPGFEFRPEYAIINFSELTSRENNEVFHFKTTINAKLFPKIDTEKIKREVAGLPITALESYTKEVPNISGFEIAFRSPFSLFRDKLPKSPKNITLEIKGR